MLNGINPKSRTRPKINNLTSFTMDSINYSRNVKSINNFSTNGISNKKITSNNSTIIKNK